MLIFVEGKATKFKRIWKIFFANKRIGMCHITKASDSDDEYYSIYLKLNQASRQLGFGWKSFAGTSLLSQIDLIHAQAAKKNKPSIASLKKAGFLESSLSSPQFNASFVNKKRSLVDIETFISLMPLSFWVDYADFSCNKHRVAIRTFLRKEIDVGEYVIEHLGLFMDVDSAGFAALGFNPEVCKEVMKLDRDIDGCNLIGKFLGYPDCCRVKIEDGSVSDIDAYAESFCEEIGDGKLLSISNYLKGRALISHIPCSTECVLSIENGKSVSNYLVNLGLESCEQIPKMILSFLEKGE